MERGAWTDERLDDLSRRVDAGFERVDGEVRELRREVHEGISGVRTELSSQVGGVRGEMGDLRGELSAQIEALRLTILRVGGGMMVGLVGVIAAILARGV
jgi:hypothetical protein